MAPKPPATRGFTLAEKRSLQFERVSLYMVLLVAIIAAVISFRALTDTGMRMGLGWSAPLLPLAIDGFAIACSVGIVRSQGAGEPGRERVSEWMGLFIALGLSVAGNVQHALVSRSESVPVLLAGLFAASIPVIVAYGIHVYGRAMSRGISAHVLADDPDQLRFDVTHLGDQAAPAPARKPAPRPSIPRPAPTTGQSATTAAPRRTPATSAPSVEKMSSAKAEAYRLYDAMVTANPVQPVAADIGKAVAHMDGAPTEGAMRKWVGGWWKVDPRNPANAAGAELHAADPAPVDPIEVEARHENTSPVRAVG